MPDHLPRPEADAHPQRPTHRVRQAYRRIEAVDRPEVWITLRDEAAAMADAAAVERRADAGEALPLAGTVVAVKDNIDVAGLPTTAGCPDYRYLPKSSSPAVARLAEAGAVVIGKTNLDQFATGLVGTRSPYGAVRNAFDPERIAGGSSSGSAVAVALGIADIGVGTDTAGSGRVPAAFNGLVGLKPTRGVVPMAGVVPACAGYDCLSVLTRDVPSAAAAVRVMAGPAAADPRARAWPAAMPMAAPPGARVAVPRSADLAALSPPYRRAFERAVAHASRRGLNVVTADFSELLDAARLLYDGAIVAQRFVAVGAFLATNPPSADPIVASIIQAGGTAGAVDYIADCDQLLAVRSRLPSVFGDACALLLPTTTDHPSIAAVEKDPLEINRRLGTYTNFCNLLDLAAVAVPAGEAEGLPFGVMFVVPAFGDQVAVDLAARYLGTATGPCLSDIGVELAVFGAHLRNQPLNHELVSLNARFVEEIATTDSYRLVALATSPPKPGLVSVPAGQGRPIAGELWCLSPAALGTFLASLPPPMALGAVTLSDGRQVVGFCCTPEAASQGIDITHHGGWVNYQLSRDERVH